MWRIRGTALFDCQLTTTIDYADADRLYNLLTGFLAPFSEEMGFPFQATPKFLSPNPPKKYNPKIYPRTYDLYSL